MLDLYHWEPTAESAAVMICLREKKVEFKSHYVDLAHFDQHSARFKKVSTRAQVPVLVGDGAAMTDVDLIAGYLVEAYPSPRLAPSDPLGWYETQAWMAFIIANLGTAVGFLGWHTVTLPSMTKMDRDAYFAKRANIHTEGEAGWAKVTSDAEASEDQLENARRRIGLAVDRMEKALAKSPWLSGPDYSIVDIAAYAQAHTLPRLVPEMVNKAKTPMILAWIEKIGARPAVKEAMAMRKSASNADVYVPA